MQLGEDMEKSSSGGEEGKKLKAANKILYIYVYVDGKGDMVLLPQGEKWPLSPKGSCAWALTHGPMYLSWCLTILF